MKKQVKSWIHGNTSKRNRNDKIDDEITVELRNIRAKNH